MTRAQALNSDLTLISEKSYSDGNGLELRAYLYEERPDADVLPNRRVADLLHVYVTRSFRGAALAARTSSLPQPNVIDPQVAVVLHLSVALRTSSTRRDDEVHEDALYQNDMLAAALNLAASGVAIEPIKVSGAHIQQLAREAMSRHKQSLSEAAVLIGTRHFGKLTNEGVSLEPFTVMEERSMRCLQSFYMLYSMGIRANMRQLIAEFWGYTDNQVKFALQFLKERGILSQRETVQQGAHIG
jgi:hypothetical protein